MAIACESNFNARCGDRFRELLSSQQGLARWFALRQGDDSDALGLGVWLGVNGRTRIATAGPVSVYECGFFSAVMEHGTERIALLTNGTFIVERPVWNNSRTVIDEDAVISEAICKLANLIGEELRCRFPISGQILSSPSAEWVMVNKGTGDGVQPNDIMLLYLSSGEEVSLVGVAKATPQSGRSLGKIVWTTKDLAMPDEIKGIATLIGPPELLTRIIQK